MPMYKCLFKHLRPILRQRRLESDYRSSWKFGKIAIKSFDWNYFEMRGAPLMWKDFQGIVLDTFTQSISLIYFLLN